jgi:hypothetical protein
MSPAGEHSLALAAVELAVALGRGQPGDAAQALFGGPAANDQSELLLVACELLWNVAGAYSKALGRAGAEDVLGDFAAARGAGADDAPPEIAGIVTLASREGHRPMVAGARRLKTLPLLLPAAGPRGEPGAFMCADLR